MEGVQQASTIAVIDIGTTKITVAVGEADDKGEVRVLGYGKVPALGVKDGSIVDIEQAVSSIREAVDEAERVAERKIERIWAAQSGKLLHSFNNEGLVVLQDGEVSEKDAQQARAMATSYDYRKDPFLQNILKERARRKDEGRLKAEEQGKERPPGDEDRFDPSDARLALYYVKGYTLNSDPALIQDPVGMHGDVLRAHAHLAVGSAHVCDNITKCLMLAGLQVNGILLQPWASAASCLTKTEKELGVIMLDFGAGSVDIACYSGGSVMLTAVLPAVGGNLITRDIAGALICSLEQAEEIKCKNGRIGISPSDRFINIPFWHEAKGVDAAVKKDYLLNLIEARVKEVLNHIRCNILEPGYWINRAAAGVVVTGGMANMPGLVEEVGKNLGLKARLGVPRPFPNSAMPLDNPEDTTVAGLFVEAVRMMSRKGKRPFKRGFGGRSVSGALGFFKRLVVGD